MQVDTHAVAIYSKHTVAPENIKQLSCNLRQTDKEYKKIPPFNKRFIKESALGWLHGSHGLRHSYAQQRMIELQVNHQLSRELTLEKVSQEMGHFRPDITETYLR